jgi:uncharacterized protein (DUF3820 family)
MIILKLKDKIPFGKYKGEAVDDIITFDVNYIKWFQTNVNGYNFDNKALNYIKRIELKNYIERVSQNSTYNSNRIVTEVDVDMGGGSKDSESECNWDTDW